MNLLIITSHGRSGSLFLQSLFDNHKEIITMPIFFEYPSWKYNSAKIALNKFIDFNPGAFHFSKGFLGSVDIHVTSLLGSQGQEDPTIDKNAFKRNFQLLFKKDINSIISRKLFVEIVHKAYALTLGIDLAKIKYCLIHIHTYSNKSHYYALEDFPKLKYLVSCRDPRESIISLSNQLLKKNPGISKKGLDVFSKIFIGFIVQSIDELVCFSKLLIPENCIVIDLETLHKFKHKGMRFLANWLGIDYSESLIFSTFLGLTWHGNRADSKSITGFYENLSSTWPKKLNKKTIFFIEFVSEKSLKILNYQISSNKNIGIKKSLYFPNLFQVFMLSLETLINQLSNSSNFNKVSLLYPKFLREFYLTLKLGSIFINYKNLFREYLKNWKITRFYLKNGSAITEEDLKQNNLIFFDEILKNFITN